MRSPEQWIKHEIRRKRRLTGPGAVPFEPWEDHVLHFHSREQALKLLPRRAPHQIDYRRKQLGIKQDPFFSVKRAEAIHYERREQRAGCCPTCNRAWRLAA